MPGELIILKTMISDCRICGGSELKEWAFREMMFGFRSQFLYVECMKCHCLQIADYPQNISVYYPPDYYSFNQDSNVKLSASPKVSLKTHVLLYNHLVAKDLLKKIGKPTYHPFQFHLQYLKNTDIKPWWKILDIGCGSGEFLVQLYLKGFKNLTGIDKFIVEDKMLFSKIPVYKKEVFDVDDRFDLITLNHVLEHMPHQKKVLSQIFDLLTSNGITIVHIPIVNEAWTIYRQNWVQLDAPRHFYLHSIESFSLLAKQVGFTIADIIFDSTEFQFWGSEQYIQDIPLRRNRLSYAENTNTKIFTQECILNWRKKADSYNKVGLGDQAIFFLKKK